MAISDPHGVSGMANGRVPYEGRDPRDLGQREFQVLISYRLEQLENRVNGIYRAVWTIAGGVITAFAVWLITKGPDVATSALSWLVRT